jgi:hypothetical protein
MKTHAASTNQNGVANGYVRPYCPAGAVPAKRIDNEHPTCKVCAKVTAQ